MSILSGRYRCDSQPSTGLDRLPPIVTWHATEAEADAEAIARGSHRTLVWFWPGEYIETAGEEGTRLVREGLTTRVRWLRKDAAA